MNYKNYKVRAFLEDILPDTQNDKHIAHVGNVPQIRVAILTAWQVVNEARPNEMKIIDEILMF